MTLNREDIDHLRRTLDALLDQLVAAAHRSAANEVKLTQLQRRVKTLERLVHQAHTTAQAAAANVPTERAMRAPSRGLSAVSNDVNAPSPYPRRPPPLKGERPGSVSWLDDTPYEEHQQLVRHTPLPTPIPVVLDDRQSDELDALVAEVFDFTESGSA